MKINLIQNSNENIKNNTKLIKRNYGIDLLRIFSMINIVNLHLNLFSGQTSFSYRSPKFFNIWLLEIFSFWAVDGFGLISGIVGYKRYKFSNLIYFWFQAWFYSTCITFYLYFINKNIMNKKYFIISLLPILSRQQWYVNAYFSMYLLLPFINYGINLLNRKVYRNLIIFFILFYSFYNLIGDILEKKSDLIQSYSSMWLTILYIIGAYFGKYIIIDKIKIDLIFYIFYLLIYIISSFLSSKIFFKLFKIKSKIPNKLLIKYVSPTVLIQAISLVMFFSRLNIKFNWNIRIISFLTPLTFSVQLIHQPLFQYKTPIKIILFNFLKSFKSNFLFFKIYGLAVIVYFICIIIDYFRFVIFKLLKIRGICLLLERKVPLLFDNFLYKLKINNFKD